jgi:hypothetical protein
MKILFFFIIYTNSILSNITFEELDYIRAISKNDSQSIIANGTNNCINYFENKHARVKEKYHSNFICKFSKTRNRFYVYMLAVDKKNALSLKEFCKEIIKSWPEISDHMENKFINNRREYLDGFFVDNLFNNKVLNFSKNLKKDELTINNEINNFILENRFNFIEDNQVNNSMISKQRDKINRIYNKFISNSETDLDKIIKSQLNKIVRYKIFINDTKKFKSYSCNWEPGKGLIPYVKKERFSEFENI